MCVCVYISILYIASLWRRCGFSLRFTVRTWYAAKDVLSPLSPTTPKSVMWHYCCFSSSLLKPFYRKLNLNVRFCCSWPWVSQVRRPALNVTITICWLSEMFWGILPCGLIWFRPEIPAPFFGWHPENTCDFSFWETGCSLLPADLGVKRPAGKWVTPAWAICYNDSENCRIKCTYQHYNKRRAHSFSPSSAWDFQLRTKTPLTPCWPWSRRPWAMPWLVEHSQVMDQPLPPQLKSLRDCGWWCWHKSQELRDREGGDTLADLKAKWSVRCGEEN